MKTLGMIPAALLVLAAAVPAQIPTVGWGHWDDDKTIAPHVSVGDLGGQVFAHFPVPCCAPNQGMLLAANEVGPSGPVAWLKKTRRDVPWDVDSAETDDVHVSIVTRERVSGAPFEVWVHRWSSSSEDKTWSLFLGTWTPGSPLGWAWGRPRVGCTSDGSVVVAMVEKPGTGGRHDVFVLDGPTGAVLSSVEVPAPNEPAPKLSAFDLAGDGSVAAWRLGRGGYVLDVANEQMLLALDDGGSEFTGGSIAVSGDGNVVALADSIPGKVRLYERATQGSAYQLVHTHQGIPEAWSGAFVDVSDDGSTVAVGYGGFNFPGNWIWVDALDVASRSLTMRDDTGYNNVGYGVCDIAISADGRRFVVGVFGGQDFDGDRILLYAPDQDEPLWTAMELVGDVRDVDISEDGRVVVVGASYLDDPGATVWLLPVESSADYVVTGAPVLGGPVDFAVAGAPGSKAFLLAATAPAVPPIVLGSSVLYLDPATLLLWPMGTVAPNGTANLSVSIPLDVTLLGVEIWTQGVTLPGTVLTESWRKLTVLP